MASDKQNDALAQETKLSVWMKADSADGARVDGVCEQLLAQFPGAVITAQNYFAAKRLWLEDLRLRSQEQLRQGTLEPWSWKTMDELNAGFDHAIADNRRAEMRSGPQKELAIPLSNGTHLKGRVGA